MVGLVVATFELYSDNLESMRCYFYGALENLHALCVDVHIVLFIIKDL